MPEPPNLHVADAAADHEPALLRYARHLTGRDAVAREVVQDTLARLLEQPVEKRGELTGGRLKAWLYTVCRNRALDIRRKERRMKPLTFVPARAADPAAGPAARAELRETQDAVLREVSGLPGDQQEALRLKFQGGLSYAEIGEVMDTTVPRVGYLIHRGLKALREALAD